MVAGRAENRRGGGRFTTAVPKGAHNQPFRSANSAAYQWLKIIVLINSQCCGRDEAKLLRNLMRLFLSQLLPSAVWNILASRNQPSSSGYNDGF